MDLSSQILRKHKLEDHGLGQTGYKYEALLEKMPDAKRAGGMAQVEQHLLSRYKALS
jgi:hypothetical protein